VRDFLRFSGNPALAQLAISLRSITLKQGASLIRFVFPAMLGYARRASNSTVCRVGALCKRDTVLSLRREPQAQRKVRPSGAAEHRRHFGIERAVLFELDLLAGRRGKSCEFGERPKWREAQGTRASGQASGSAFLLVTFLWQSKEKYLAREGRNPGWMILRQKKQVPILLGRVSKAQRPGVLSAASPWAVLRSVQPTVNFNLLL